MFKNVLFFSFFTLSIITVGCTSQRVSTSNDQVNANTSTNVSNTEDLQAQQSVKQDATSNKVVQPGQTDIKGHELEHTVEEAILNTDK